MKFLVLFDNMEAYIAQAPNVHEFLKQLLKDADAPNQKLVNILIDSNKMDIPELIHIIHSNCCLHSDITHIYAISEEIYCGDN